MGITAHADVRLTWLQDQAAPLGGRYLLYASAGPGGTVNYAEPIAERAAWPDGGEGKGGFGLGGLGDGDFGYGDEGGPGFGEGAFGYGEFGFGCELMSAVLDHVGDGAWLYAVAAADEAGNVATPAALEPLLVVAGEPDDPAGLEADSYAGGVLGLTFDLSDDDDAA